MDTHWSQILVNVVEAVVLIATLLWAVFAGRKQLKSELSGRRYERLKSLQDEFLSPEWQEKREQLFSAIQPALWWPPAEGSVDTVPICDHPLVAGPLRQLLSGMGVGGLPTASGLDTDSALRDLAAEVCNRYEFLSRLWRAGVVTQEDLRATFYSSIGDTFLLLVPYILERRESKPDYAEGFQALAAAIPNLSRSPRLG